jgi:hypothetical protein
MRPYTALLAIAALMFATVDTAYDPLETLDYKATAFPIVPEEITRVVRVANDARGGVLLTVLVAACRYPESLGRAEYRVLGAPQGTFKVGHYVATAGMEASPPLLSQHAYISVIRLVDQGERRRFNCRAT